MVGVALLALAVTGAVAHDDDGDGDIKNHHHFREQSQKQYNGGNKTGSAWNMVAVGQENLDARGFNGDVWVHEEHAYVGQWGFGDWATGNARFCPTAPQNGVAVIDATDPAHPDWVATLQNVDGSSAEDIVVYTARFGAFAGRDIAVAGIQDCSGSRYEPEFATAVSSSGT